MRKYDALIIGHITTEEFYKQDNTENIYYGGEALFASYAMKAVGTDVGIITKMSPEQLIIFDLLSVSKEDVVLGESKNDTHLIYKKSDTTNKYDDIKVASLAESFSVDDIPLGYNSGLYYLAGTFREEYTDGMLKDLAERGKIAASLQVF